VNRPDPLSTAVEVAPAGWRGRFHHADRLVVDRDGVHLRIGRRSGTVPAATLDRAEVWRGSDGIRRCRLLDVEGAELAVLHDQAWRLPQGRLSPLLERLGCRVTSVDAPQPPRDVVGQTVAGGRFHGVRGRWVVVAGVALLAVASFTLGFDDASVDGLRATLMYLTTGLIVGLVVLVGTWWSTADPVPKPAGARPRNGRRVGWLREARAGLATTCQSGHRVVVNDGWGRVLCTPMRGPLAPGTVACGADAAVVLAQDGSPLLRFPVREWGAPEETVEDLAARVAEACELSPAGRGAPAGGEVIQDPEPPSLVLPTLAGLGLAVPLGSALLAGLIDTGRRSPQPMVWLPAAVALLVPVTVLVGTLLQRFRRARGSVHRAVPVTTGGLVLTYPLWAGLGLVGLPLLAVPVLSPAALRVWMTLLLGVGVIGLAILIGARTGGPPGWRAAVAIVPVASGPLALGGRDVLPPVLVGSSVALAVAAAGIGLLGLRHPRGRTGRRGRG
jgi:hypothetical protein